MKEILKLIILVLFILLVILVIFSPIIISIITGNLWFLLLFSISWIPALIMSVIFTLVIQIIDDEF